MFNVLRMQRQVREAVADGARLRVRGAFWSIVSAAIAVVGVFFVAMAMRGGHVEGAVALVAFAAATPPAVWSYWAWSAVARADQRIVDVVSMFAERVVESRIGARDDERAFESSLTSTEPAL